MWWKTFNLLMKRDLNDDFIEILIVFHYTYCSIIIILLIQVAVVFSFISNWLGLVITYRASYLVVSATLIIRILFWSFSLVLPVVQVKSPLQILYPNGTWYKCTSMFNVPFDSIAITLSDKIITTNSSSCTE